MPRSVPCTVRSWRGTQRWSQGSLHPERAHSLMLDRHGQKWPDGEQSACSWYRMAPGSVPGDIRARHRSALEEQGGRSISPGPGGWLRFYSGERTETSELGDGQSRGVRTDRCGARQGQGGAWLENREQWERVIDTSLEKYTRTRSWSNVEPLMIYHN